MMISGLSVCCQNTQNSISYCHLWWKCKAKENRAKPSTRTEKTNWTAMDYCAQDLLFHIKHILWWKGLKVFMLVIIPFINGPWVTRLRTVVRLAIKWTFLEVPLNCWIALINQEIVHSVEVYSPVSPWNAASTPSHHINGLPPNEFICKFHNIPFRDKLRSSLKFLSQNFAQMPHSAVWQKESTLLHNHK